MHDDLTPDDGPQTVNLPGGARLVGVTTSAVRYWIITGLLPAKLVRGHWVIQKEDLYRANEEAKLHARAGTRGRRGTFTPIQKV